MNDYKIYYKRNLPHYQPPGHTFFVTFRLNGSLPVEVVKELKEEREKELKIIDGYNNLKVRNEKYREHQSRYFGKFDKLLDSAAYGPKWLKEDKVAQIVKDAIHHRDNKEYELLAYTIMINHVHLVITPIVTRSEASRGKHEAYASCYILTKILQDLKSKTALKCNKILNHSGAFWQHESYDHVVRDNDELLRIIQYVLDNPVKVGLCDKWEDWKWNYCNFELLG